MRMVADSQTRSSPGEERNEGGRDIGVRGARAAQEKKARANRGALFFFFSLARAASEVALQLWTASRHTGSPLV